VSRRVERLDRLLCGCHGRHLICETIAICVSLSFEIICVAICTAI
jgi:hypothetical protein